MSEQTTTQWQYLEQRPDSWRKQLYIKNRKLKAFTVWINLKVNEMTPEEGVENWDLPIEAIYEAIEYCEQNQELLKQEAEAERQYLEAQGVQIEPKNSRG